MKTRKTFLLAALTLLAVVSFAQEQQEPKKHSQRVQNICGPYIQNVTQTGFTVMWISDVDAVAWVEVAPVDGTHFYNRERPKFYDLSGCGVRPVNKIHRVTVDGLAPGTKYRYRIMMQAVDQFYFVAEIASD